MTDNAPSRVFRSAGEASHPPLDNRRLEEFRQQMEDLDQLQKAKNKAFKAKKQQDRLIKQKSFADQFKRAQRYLGLRPSVVAGAAQSFPPNAIDPSRSTPYPFEKDVVIVSVDVESYERAHHMITEVGVATLDTRDLIGVAPGTDGENWRNEIRARHFRINEYRHLVNSEFVAGHPDGFDFGESTFVLLDDTAQQVAACFEPPFGAHHSNGAGDIATLMSKIDLSEKRNIIFLGHDVMGDIDYLQQLGYNPLKVENILEALDTSVLYKFWRRETQSASLGRILVAMDIPGYKLHNAGNDAVFTLQAMLAICTREATIRGSTKLDSMRSEARSARLAVAMEDAQQRVKDDAEGWSDNEADGDGGAPVPLTTVGASRPTAAQSTSHITSQYNGSFDPGGRGTGQGRGRRQAGSGSAYTFSGGTHRGNSYQGSGGSRGSPGRGVARGQTEGRGRGRGRLSEPSGSSSSHNAPVKPQVKYHW